MEHSGGDRSVVVELRAASRRVRCEAVQQCGRQIGIIGEQWLVGFVGDCDSTIARALLLGVWAVLLNYANWSSSFGNEVVTIEA